MMRIVLPMLIATAAASAVAAETVNLPVEPPERVTVEYQELWRTDPYSDEYLMGNVRDAVVDDEGNFYFLDTQLQEVSKFDADGNFVALIARKGEGPGELEQTWQIAYWPPNEIILPRVFPPRIVRLDEDGTPLEALRVFRNEGDDSPASVSTLVPVGDRAVVRGAIFMFDDKGGRSINWLGLIERDGTLVREYDSKETEMSADPLHQVVDETAEFWSWSRWAATPAGDLFVAPEREKWLVEQRDLEGSVVNTYVRDIPPRPRTDEEFESMRNSRSFVFNGRKAEVDYKLLDTEPPISFMRAVGDELWVFHNLTDDQLPADVVWRVSVLAAGGEFLGERDLKIPHDPDLDVVDILPDGHVMVIENGVAANRAAMAAFGDGDDEEEDEDLSDAEPAEVVIYAPKR